MPRIPAARWALIFWIGGVACIVGLRPVNAVELIMVESPICAWCETWNDEVGVIYDRTAQGLRAPLQRIDIDIDDVEGSRLRIDRPVTYTPTFLLIDDAKEVGRITGYPGESHFWLFLDELLKKVPATKAHGCPQKPPKTAQSNEITGNPLC